MGFSDLFKGSTINRKELDVCIHRIEKLEEQNVELAKHIVHLQKSLESTSTALGILTVAHQQLAVDINTIYQSLQNAMEIVTGAPPDSQLSEELALFKFGWDDDDDDLPN